MHQSRRFSVSLGVACVLLVAVFGYYLAYWWYGPGTPALRTLGNLRLSVEASLILASPLVYGVIRAYLRRSTRFAQRVVAVGVIMLLTLIWTIARESSNSDGQEGLNVLVVPFIGWILVLLSNIKLD